jgi:hypothetical protein
LFLKFVEEKELEFVGEREIIVMFVPQNDYWLVQK